MKRDPGMIRAEREARARLAVLVSEARGATSDAEGFVRHLTAAIVRAEGETAERQIDAIEGYARALYALGTSRRDRRRNAAQARRHHGR